MKPVHIHLAAAIAATFAVGASSACAKQQEPESRENVEQAFGPREDKDWLDAPQTPGEWSYRQLSGESFAEFTTPDGRQLVSFNCTTDRRIFLGAYSPDLAERTISVRTETQSRILPTTAREGRRVAVLAPSDALLDAMAITKGRFAIEVEGMAPLYIPAWAEVTRVIEDCR